MEFKSNFDDIENYFSMLLNSIPIPTLLWKKRNNSLTLVSSNEESSRISGGKIKDYIGRNASEIYHDNSQVLKGINECVSNNNKITITANKGNPIVNNGFSYNISFEHIAPDTIIQYFTANSSVKKKILRNGFSKKNGKQDRSIQEATLKSIDKAAPIGIGRVVNRNFVHVNDRFCDLIGYDREELINKNARMIYPTDEEYEYVGREKYDQINKYGIGTVETLFKRKDGKILQVLLSSTLVDPKYPSLGATFTVLDITKRKKIESELINREKRFLEFVKVLPSALFEADTLGNLSFVNDIGFELFGYNREDIKNGFNTLELLISPDRKRALNNIARMIEGEELGGVEYLAQKKTEKYFLF